MSTVRAPSEPAVAARYIGTHNAELIMGYRWRWCRDQARKRGVRIFRVDGKMLIDALELAAAFEKAAVEPVVDPVVVDAREELRRRLGPR